MKEYTVSETENIVKDELTLGLEEVFRRGARQTLEVTLDWEVGQYIEKYRNLLDEKGTTRKWPDLNHYRLKPVGFISTESRPGAEAA